jgi:flagellar M-ring protein FliF
MGSSSPLASILDRWNQLPRARQIALGAIVAGTIVVLYLVLKGSSSPNMVVAFDNLQPEDSAAMAAELTKDGIPYELGSTGSSISVAANRLGEARIKLASVGLLKNGAGIGFEIFDKTNFGATDKVQDINYMRALQGELSRTINTIDGVKGSRVAIVLPKEALFKDDQQKTTASVLLQLKSGTQLDQSQVRGITNLVANSVPGLAQGGVTIVDQSGHVLFDGTTFDSPFASGQSSTQMDLQHKYELALQRDVEATLGKVVGAGKSAVTVRAQLNFDTVKEAKDTFPGAAVPRSSSTTTESFNGSNLQTGAIPGTGSNGGAAAAASGANGNSTYTRTDTTTNNEIPKTTTTTVKAPGSLQKLSVSVVLDDSVTAAQEASLTSAVAAAVGLDQARGDILSVTRLPFDPSATADVTPAAGNGMGQYLNYLKLLLPLLAVVLAFVLVMLLLRALGKRQAAFGPGYHASVLQPDGTMALPPAPKLPALQAQNDPSEERVFNLATQNPRAVADVVQTWMREEDN